MKTLLRLLAILPLFACNNSNAQIPSDTIRTDSIVQKQTITLLFAGDLMQHQAQIDAARTSTGYNYTNCFEHVRKEISAADVAIGNLEVTLGGKPYAGYPAFSAPDEYLQAIKEAGFDVLTFANNHCLDRGKSGLERTILLMDSAAIGYLGAYANPDVRQQKYPYLIEKNGFRIALLNYTYGTNGIKAVSPNVVNYIEKAVMEQDINQTLTLLPDVIIACMHWGEEYVSLPSKQQRELADWLLTKGVTHIIGAHPHVVQPMEVRTDSIADSKHIVVYSMGNLISNMSKRGTDGGIFFKMTLEKDSVTRVADCGYSLVWTDRPAISGKQNYVLYPANHPTDSLTETSRNKLSIFTKDARKLFEEHNIGIEEYFFH